nr:hypothetical protein [uncultured Prevotella sp.]
MKKLEEMGLVPSNKKECVEHDGGNDKPVFKGIKPDALQNSSFWAPLKSTTPKWWLITALLIIDTFVSLFALQFLTSAISFIAMILIGGLICFFLYCLYFKLFEK